MVVPQPWVLGARGRSGLHRSGGFHQQRGPGASLFLLAGVAGASGTEPRGETPAPRMGSGAVLAHVEAAVGSRGNPQGHRPRSRKILSQLGAQHHLQRKAASVFLIRSLKELVLCF